MLRTNRVKEMLREGKLVVGSEISRFRSDDIPRVYAAAGLDFVFIDMEHSSFSLETVADMIESAHRNNIAPLVRVPQAEYSYVSRVLDAGASGIIVPRVNRPETVHRLVQWMRYPPHGERGFACTVGQTSGIAVSPQEFIEWSHRNTLLAIQFERREAIDNLDEMLSIEGVDVACLGYMDLTVDLGCPGDLKNAEARRCVERIVEVSQAHQVAAGIITPDLDTAMYWIEQGMRFVSFATESILLERAASQMSQQIRRTLTGKSLPTSNNAHRHPPVQQP